MDRRLFAYFSAGLYITCISLLSGCGIGGNPAPVSPPPPAVTIQAHVVENLGKVYLAVSATSADGGVTAVSATVDGSSLGSTQTQPSACLGQCYPGIVNSYYGFAVDMAAAGSATHTIVVTATNGKGQSSTQTSTATFNNLPLLTLDAPVSGELVNGTLPISGTFGTNKSGAAATLVFPRCYIFSGRPCDLQ
jgi:uncharacterized protein (DUF697 family)